MMTDLNLSAYVWCPFFGHLNPYSVVCEFEGRREGIALRFGSQGQKVRMMKRRCFSECGHRACPVAGANYEFYENQP